MSYSVDCTAAPLRAMLQFIDPEKGPQIACDDDSLAGALVEKVKTAVGDSHGSQPVTITFWDEEDALAKQFKGVAKNISRVFYSIDCVLDLKGD